MTLTQCKYLLDSDFVSFLFTGVKSVSNSILYDDFSQLSLNDSNPQIHSPLYDIIKPWISEHFRYSQWKSIINEKYQVPLLLNSFRRSEWSQFININELPREPLFSYGEQFKNMHEYLYMQYRIIYPLALTVPEIAYVSLPKGSLFQQIKSLFQQIKSLFISDKIILSYNYYQERTLKANLENTSQLMVGKMIYSLEYLFDSYHSILINMDLFRNISQSLALHYSRISLTTFMYQSMNQRLGSPQVCLRKVSDLLNIDKSVLVQAYTYYNNTRFRFLVLVTLGVGCTVWYMTMGGVFSQRIPENGMQFEFLPYDEFYQFFNHGHRNVQFHKLTFVETEEISNIVNSVISNDIPLAKINDIPDENLRTAVGLGLILALFLSIGIVPNISTLMEI